MTLIASLIEQAERFLPQMAANARLNGHFWDEIAHAIGTSSKEAHLRFDPESPVDDSRCPTTTSHRPRGAPAGTAFP